MMPEKIDIVLWQDEEDELFYIEPSYFKENTKDLLIPLSEEEEKFTETNRITLQEVFYDYIWANVISDDKTESEENLKEFKEQILALIDAAFAENKENYDEDNEKIKNLGSREV